MADQGVGAGSFGSRAQQDALEGADGELRGDDEGEVLAYLSLSLSLSLSLYIYIYIVYMHVYIYIHIYIYCIHVYIAI